MITNYIKDLKFWISITAIVVSIATAWHGCNQNKLLKEQINFEKDKNSKEIESEYYKNALLYRPDIDVADTPYIDTLSQYITYLGLDTTNKSNENNGLQGAYVINYRLKFVNKGNSKAKILLIISGISKTLDNKLPPAVKRAVLNNEKLDFHIITGITTQINNFDTITYNFIDQYPRLGEDTLVLHHLIIYMSEAGVVYETYYKAIFKIPYIKYIGHFRNLKIPFRLVTFDGTQNKEFRYIRKISDSHYYDKDYAYKFLEYLNNH